MANKLAVPIVVGTRPEAIKLVPIIVAMRESPDYEPIVISTGQHNRMVEYIFELAEIRPDVTLWAGSRRSNLNERVASVMQRFEDFCVERFQIDPDVAPTRDAVLAGEHPACVLVHGDTSSAMAAALSSFHMRIPVMHVEAGLRTGGINLTPFPEELNRQVISTIAAMHFAPTSANLENLVRENIPVEQARTQVQQYMQQFKDTLAKTQEQAKEAADATARKASQGSLFGALALVLGALAAFFAGRGSAVDPVVTRTVPPLATRRA